VSRATIAAVKPLLRFCLLLVMIACAAHGAERVSVSSFSTVLTEIAEQVGGKLVDVRAHVPRGVDPHDYEPKPADLQLAASSDLILLSAKHMEGYVNKLQEALGTKGTLVPVGDRFPSLKMSAEEGGGTVEDPHWWHSVANAQRATKVVRDELSKVRPAEKATFAKNAEAYLAQLDALQKWVKTKVAELPRNQRKLVTSHDAFGYFAKENGFAVFPVEGVSTAEQPSTKKVAELIQLIKEQRVKAIFAENIENPKVLREITRETGARLAGELYADGLGDGPASTYSGMMKHNVSTIVDALK